MQIERKNAQIERVSFGKDDHGIMSLMLFLKYNGSGQGFGGYALDTWDESRKRRVGTAYGMEWIMRLMDTVGVTDFSDFVGLYVRVEADRNKVYRIGHFLEEKWFDPEVTDLKEFIESNGRITS